MLVKDVMVTNPVVVQSGASVTQVQELMRKNDTKIIPVTDKQGTLIGVVTRSDIRKSSPSDATTLDMFELSYLMSKLTVDKVMVKSVKTTSEDQTVEEAARLMADYGINCLPVVKNGLVIGLITEKDLFNAFIDMFGTRHSGVRATFIMHDKPGALNTFTQKLVEYNGNIVSLVTADVEDRSSRKVTIRVAGVTIEQMQSVIADCGGELQDIRNV